MPGVSVEPALHTKPSGNKCTDLAIRDAGVSIRTADSFLEWAADMWCSDTKISCNMHKLSMKQRKSFSPPAEDLEHDS